MSVVVRLIVAAASCALALPALALDEAAPAAAEPAAATPTDAPKGECDCGDGKPCDPSKHHGDWHRGGEGHHGRMGRHGPDGMGGDHRGGMRLSDMDNGGEGDEAACNPEDEMCQHLRDHGDKLPPPMRMMAHRLMGPLQIDPRGLIQTQFAGMAGKDTSLDHGDRAERMGFALRRARFGFSGRYGERATFGVFGDLASNPQSSAGILAEAWAELALWHNASLTVGAHRTPFSQSAMLSSAHMALAERAQAVQALAPFRQVGATLAGSYPTMAGIQWYVGAYNGFERGKNFYAGMNEFSGLGGNRNSGVAMVARVAVAPWGEMGPQTYDTTGGGLRAQIGVSAYQSTGPTTTLSGHGLDIHVKAKGAHLLVEFMADSGTPKDAPTEAATIPATIGRRAMILEAGYTKWRFGGALRAQLIDTNVDNTTDPEEQIFSGALNYQLPGDRVRLQLQFDHRKEANGLALDNDVGFAQLQLLL